MTTLYRDQGAPAPAEYAAARRDGSSPGIVGADDACWKNVTAIEWGPERYRTRFQACWDAQALHIRFDSVDSAPWFTMRKRDDHLWEEEVVEIFLDPAGAGVNYAELEINPANVVCDLRVERPAPDVRSLTEWDWSGLETSVVPYTNAHGAPEGWTALARLPFEGLRSLSADIAARVPPAPGDAWRFNVFRIKRPGGPGRPADGAIFAAWSVPEGPSFHVPAAFRGLRFTS